jgi:nitrate reductase alpha subunit
LTSRMEIKMAENVFTAQMAEAWARSPKLEQQSTAEMYLHSKRPILRAIRAKCLDCCVNQIDEVRKCTAIDCDLWPYRMGKNPFSNVVGNAGNLAGGDDAE